MTEHYFTESPSARHDRTRFEAELRGQRYTFASDAGVFSKQGIDYGSRLLIEHVRLPADARVLDVGCGYGPIGLAAARLAEKGFVTMIDVNERAVQLARENAELNGIRNVEIRQSDLFEQVARRDYTHILTNPPIRAGKETVHAIYGQSLSYLAEGGELWVVIQKKQGAPSTFAKLEQLFGRVEEVTKDKGYRVFRAVKAT